MTLFIIGLAVALVLSDLNIIAILLLIVMLAMLLGGSS